jgi:hypothetical protein
VHSQLLSFEFDTGLMFSMPRPLLPLKLTNKRKRADSPLY